MLATSFAQARSPKAVSVRMPETPMIVGAEVCLVMALGRWHIIDEGWGMASWQTGPEELVLGIIQPLP